MVYEKALITFLLLVTFNAYAQIDTPEIFVDFGLYYEDEFEPKPKIYVGASAGIELFSYKFIAPEIKLSYFAGSDLDEFYNLDISTGLSNGWFLNRSMKSSVLTFSPKLVYGNKEFRLVVIPEYNIANIKAKGVFSEIEKNAITKLAEVKDYYWSASIGIEGYGWSESTRIGFYINYSALDAGKALNQLDFEAQGFSKPNYNTKTLGATLRLLYHFKTGRKK